MTAQEKVEDVSEFYLSYYGPRLLIIASKRSADVALVKDGTITQTVREHSVMASWLFLMYREARRLALPMNVTDVMIEQE